MKDIAKIIMIMGGALLATGLGMYVVASFTQLGKLPGDITIKHDNVSFSFPITTCIILSIIISVLLNIFLRHR